MLVTMTIASALSLGSLLLNMPDLTKTPLAPNRIINDASAGVAIPPAAKLAAGYLPNLAVKSTSS